VIFLYMMSNTLPCDRIDSMSVLTPMELHAATTFPQSSLLGHWKQKMFDCFGACLTLDAPFRVRDI